MKYEIDQSGKIEDTSKDTVVAISNGSFFTIRVKAREKRKLLSVYRSLGRPRSYIVEIISVLFWLLLQNRLEKNGTVVIDIEYPGKSGVIRKLLGQLGSKNELVVFRRIGKNSSAHRIAYGTYTKKIPPSKNMSATEILLITKKLISI